MGLLRPGLETLLLATARGVQFMIKFSVYADGSSGGGSNQPCGWGWVVLMDGYPIAAGSGGYHLGTNNVAELMGAREGLRALMAHSAFSSLKKEERTVELVSDSQYVLGLANGSFSASKNTALAEHVREISAKVGASTRWVRGHAGDPLNEMCDKLAKEGKYAHGGKRPNPKRGARRKKRRKLVDTTVK